MKMKSSDSAAQLLLPQVGPKYIDEDVITVEEEKDEDVTFKNDVPFRLPKWPSIVGGTLGVSFLITAFSVFFLRSYFLV